MRKKLVFFAVFAVVLLMVYITVFGVHTSKVTLLGAKDMRFGIDIRGGVEATFLPVGLDRKPTKQELEAAREVIELRLDNLNITDREVTADVDGGYIIVRFPWKTGETDFNPEDAIAELGETAQLTFQDDDGNIIADGSQVVNAQVKTDENSQYVVSLTFDEKGTQAMSGATAKMIGKNINIFMDKQNIETAQVQDHITTGEAQIGGMHNYDEAKKLADKINAGSLPFSLTTKNYSTISPTLGSGALKIMLQAGLIAFCIVCAVLLCYYRVPGFVAIIALTMQVTGQILALSIPQMTLTLEGIAGLILSIGMGVDANVISSERISEEIKSGKSVASAIASGFSNSFSAIFDGNITVLIVAFIMMIYGTGSLLSFAYTLFTGIVFNFIAGVAASRLMIFSLSSYKFLNKPKLYSCFSRRVTL